MKIKNRIMVNKVLTMVITLFCIGSCTSQSKGKKQYNGKIDQAFKEYLITQKIPFKELNNSVYSSHFSNFLKIEKKQKLEKNPNIKIDKVYVYYRTPNSVEFSLYSDDENFYLSTYDLDIDGKILSLPENGVVKVLEPITLKYFGDYELSNDIIKTKKRVLGPFSETYYHINGSIKNDTIYFTEKYEGKKYKFEKKFFSKKHKDNFIEVYQPNLKARKYVNNAGLTNFEVTGEFNVEK